MKFFSSNRLERLWLLAKIEFKLRYYENKLGLLWALIKPITDITIYYTAFNIVIPQHIPSYVAYLFIGLIVWNFFVETTTGTVQILKTKKFLYEYNNMQKIDIYISTIMSSCIGLSFNLAMFFLYYFLVDSHGANISKVYLPAYFFLIPMFLLLFLLCTAFSIILSSIYVMAKDIHQIWQVASGLLFILSPIVFKLEDYMRALPWALELNPMAGIIINFRRVIMESRAPDFHLFMIDSAYAICGLFIGLLLLKKYGSLAAEKI